MSSLGQLVAGVAHEINNPVNFIHGNLDHMQQSIEDLLGFVELYDQQYPQPTSQIQAAAEEIDLEFLREDLPKILTSMKLGTERIRQIVLSLRNFSRMDEAEYKAVDIRDGIDSTLLILQHRLKARPEHPEIEVIKHYDKLPLVECFASSGSSRTRCLEISRFLQGSTAIGTVLLICSAPQILAYHKAKFKRALVW